MHRIEPIVPLVLGLVAFFAVCVYAEIPSEQLKQMVEQLQKNPSDNALREKIIKLAQEIKPSPAVPEEAERRMVRGIAAFESAKDISDYENAIREFQASADAAPWHPKAYFNLGIAQEMANRPKEAMASFRFYLLGAPDAKNAADVRKRIYKLEYSAEQAAEKAATIPAGPKGECIAKVKEAAKMILDKGLDQAVQEINNKFGKFVWNDTYVFLMDLDGNMIAHPMSSGLRGKNLLGMKDKGSPGKIIFKEFVEVAKTKGEGWVDYMWNKPGEQTLYKKITYIYRVPGKYLLVGAAIYE